MGHGLWSMSQYFCSTAIEISGEGVIAYDICGTVQRERIRHSGIVLIARQLYLEMQITSEVLSEQSPWQRSLRLLKLQIS